MCRQGPTFRPRKSNKLLKKICGKNITDIEIDEISKVWQQGNDDFYIICIFKKSLLVTDKNIKM
jgi:hypothetical protein